MGCTTDGDHRSLARGAVVMSNAGSVAHVLTLAAAGVDCVVIQGSDAGGHTHPGASAFAVLPEARDALDAAGHAEVLLAYAGGVCDGRRGRVTPFALTPFALTPFTITPFALTPFALTPFALTPFALTPRYMNAGGASSRRHRRHHPAAFFTRLLFQRRLSLLGPSSPSKLYTLPGFFRFPRVQGSRAQCNCMIRTSVKPPL